MNKIKFDDSELRVVGETPAYRRPDLPMIPIYNFPIPPREAYRRFMKKDPVWQITGIEMKRFCPVIYPDNVARGYLAEAEPLQKIYWGGKDIFGIEWEYDDENRGSAVVPGNPLFTDACRWEHELCWPDIESWDWKISAEVNRTYVSGPEAVIPVIMNGYFERLVTFMDFSSAAIALIDDLQKEAVKALFERLTDLYIKVIDKFIDYFNVDGFIVHDDWGAQTAPLFSAETAAEMIVPAMKRLTDHIHNKGITAELHSCGFLDVHVPNFIAAGWDAWTPQPVNDTHDLYEKYGDRIIIGVIPDRIPENADERKQRDEAARFVDKFCNPDKPAQLSIYGAERLTPVFREELYRLSRKRFG